MKINWKITDEPLWWPLGAAERLWTSAQGDDIKKVSVVQIVSHSVPRYDPR